MYLKTFISLAFALSLSNAASVNDVQNEISKGLGRNYHLIQSLNAGQLSVQAVDSALANEINNLIHTINNSDIDNQTLRKTLSGYMSSVVKSISELDNFQNSQPSNSLVDAVTDLSNIYKSTTILAKKDAIITPAVVGVKDIPKSYVKLKHHRHFHRRNLHRVNRRNSVNSNGLTNQRRRRNNNYHSETRRRYSVKHHLNLLKRERPIYSNEARTRASSSYNKERELTKRRMFENLGSFSGDRYYLVKRQNQPSDKRPHHHHPPATTTVTRPAPHHENDGLGELGEDLGKDIDEVGDGVAEGIDDGARGNGGEGVDDLGDIGEDIGDASDVGEDIGDAADIGDDIGEAADIGDDIGEAADVGEDIGDIADVGDVLGDLGGWQQAKVKRQDFDGGDFGGDFGGSDFGGDFGDSGLGDFGGGAFDDGGLGDYGGSDFGDYSSGLDGYGFNNNDYDLGNTYSGSGGYLDDDYGIDNSGYTTGGYSPSYGYGNGGYGPGYGSGYGSGYYSPGYGSGYYSPGYASPIYGGTGYGGYSRPYGYGVGYGIGSLFSPFLLITNNLIGYSPAYYTNVGYLGNIVDATTAALASIGFPYYRRGANIYGITNLVTGPILSTVAQGVNAIINVLTTTTGITSSNSIIPMAISLSNALSRLASAGGYMGIDISSINSLNNQLRSALKKIDNNASFNVNMPSSTKLSDSQISSLVQAASSNANAAAAANPTLKSIESQLSASMSQAVTVTVDPPAAQSTVTVTRARAQATSRQRQARANLH